MLPTPIFTLLFTLVLLPTSQATITGPYRPFQMQCRLRNTTHVIIYDETSDAPAPPLKLASKDEDDDKIKTYRLLNVPVKSGGKYFRYCGNCSVVLAVVDTAFGPLEPIKARHLRCQSKDGIRRMLDEEESDCILALFHRDQKRASEHCKRMDDGDSIVDVIDFKKVMDVSMLTLHVFLAARTRMETRCFDEEIPCYDKLVLREGRYRILRSPKCALDFFAQKASVALIYTDNSTQPMQVGLQATSEANLGKGVSIVALSLIIIISKALSSIA